MNEIGLLEVLVWKAILTRITSRGYVQNTDNTPGEDNINKPGVDNNDREEPEMAPAKNRRMLVSWCRVGIKA